MQLKKVRELKMGDYVCPCLTDGTIVKKYLFQNRESLKITLDNGFTWSWWREQWDTEIEVFDNFEDFNARPRYLT